MGITRWGALVGALGVGSLSLAGCEVSELYGADCTTNPPIPHQNFGAISVVVDVPPEVSPGETFTLTVESIGVEAGPSESPPPAREAAVSLGGTSSPSGTIVIGSLVTPAVWPHEIEVTVTGAAGETVDFAVLTAAQFYGTPVNGYRLQCQTDGTPLVSIPIVEPEA